MKTCDRPCVCFPASLSDILDAAIEGHPVDRFIQDALNISGKTLAVSSMHILMIEKDTNRVEASKSWLREGHGKINIRSLTLEDFPADMGGRGIFVCPDAEGSILDGFDSFMKKTSAGSFILIPLFQKGSTIGYLFADDGEERIWTRNEIEFLVFISKMIILYLENETIRNSLNRRITLENCISRIAVNYMKGDSFKRKIEYMLGELGKALEASNTYIFVRSEDKKFCINEYAWNAKGQAGKMNPMDSEHFSGIIKKLAQNEIVHIPDLRKLPEGDMARKMMESVGLEKGFMIPIRADDELWGCIGFGYANREHTWKEEDISLLLTIAGMTGWLISVDKAINKRA